MGDASNVRPRGGRDGGLRRSLGQLARPNRGPGIDEAIDDGSAGKARSTISFLVRHEGLVLEARHRVEEALDLVILLHVELQASSDDRSSPHVSLGLLAPWVLIPTRPPSPLPSTLLRSRASGAGR